MKPHTSYQVMPALTDDEYAALKGDIAEHGVLVPVEYDEHGVILDGHHRVRACQDLGIEGWPRVIRPGLTDADKRRHARVLNLTRRHLTRTQRRQLIADEVTADPNRSDRAIGRLLGVDHKTVGSVRRELAGEVPHHGPPVSDAEQVTLTPSMRADLDAFEFALLVALGDHGIPPALIIGWLTMAQRNLARVAQDQGLFAWVCDEFLTPRIAMLAEHGEELAAGLRGPDVCVHPLSPDEAAQLARGISSGGALVGIVAPGVET
jgi:hypothetical protein